MMRRRDMKNRIYQKIAGRLLVTTLALLLAVSCKDDKETVSGFALDQAEVQFVNNGGILELNVSTDQEWTAESDADWCLVSPANGIGSGICKIQADSSYLYKERIGKIRFYAGREMKEFVVKQFGYEQVIEFVEEEVTIPSYATPDKAFVDVVVSANIPFEVIVAEEDKQWLKIEGASTYDPSTTIPRKQSFRFKFGTYTEFSADRIAEITFREIGKKRDGSAAEPIVKTMRIVQEAAPRIIPSREGDSLAVLSISRMMGLGSMAFPTSRPITHWNDVETAERTYIYDDGTIREERTELRVTAVRFFMFDTDEGIPYQVKYLTELEVFIASGNGNAQQRKIDLGPEITQLTKLKSLSLMGYGFRSLPPEMVNMKSLEELDLNGNNFLKIPVDIFYELPNLKYLNMGGNRIAGSVVNLQTDIPRGFTLETIGLGGELPEDLFRLNQLESLVLSYNYFYGSIPALEGEKNVMPNLKQLSLNLNRFTGNLPDWILNHKRLACWTPYILLFEQEGKDQRGVTAMFANQPNALPNPDCPDWKEDEEETLLNLPKLTARDKETKIPLHGQWRYYQMLNK